MNYCLTTAYLAPVAYYSVLAKADSVILEQHETYVKQTYRNRCRIAGANGTIDLSIPVVKEKKEGKQLTRDLRISDHSDWQRQHWRTIESAYNSSPFFEYYKDDLMPYYDKKWDFLWDFNQELQAKMLNLLDLDVKIELSTEYQIPDESNVFDLRDKLQPKKEPEGFVFKPYYQVFSRKLGFFPNLSIIDLLFNMGNESILVLENNH